MERKTIITHGDADGIISARLIQKLFGISDIFFSGPNSISKTIDSMANKKQRLIILDIAPTQEVLDKAKAFKEVLWVDHHAKLEIREVPKNVRLVIRQSQSTAEAISQEFQFTGNEKIIKIANEIDTNNVKSQDAERLRDYINYIKETAKGIIFVPMAKQLINRLDNLNFLSRPEIAFNVVAHKIQEKEKAENIKPSIVEIRGEKLAFVEPKMSVPVYEIYKKTNADYLVILMRKHKGTKIEFRTHSDKDVLKLAELFKGGGHLHAAGAFTENVNLSNIRKRIISFIKKKI